jgi:GNAT superfamily N-acetyltransferase
MNVHVQRLREGVRPQLLAHFLRLPAEDLRLRFGTTFGPSGIARYIEGIDFDRDAVLGVYDDALTLIGVVHVAFSGDSAELGLSILPGHRGRGVGSALFARAADHARNRFIKRLYMHCLSENAAIMHIAKKSGMSICIDTGEAEAFLKLRPADPASLTGEMVDQRLALFDYALKTQTAALRRITDSLGDNESET